MNQKLFQILSERSGRGSASSESRASLAFENEQKDPKMTFQIQTFHH